MKHIRLAPIPILFYLEPSDTGLREERGRRRDPAQGPHPLVPLYRDVIRRAEARGAAADAASAMVDLAKCLMNDGRAGEGLPVAQEAVQRFHDLKEMEREGLAMEVVALIYRALGRVPESIDMMERSVTLAEQAGSLDMLASRLQAVGGLRMQVGDWDGAAALLAKSARHAESLQLHGVLGPTLLGLGQCHSQRQDPEQAVSFYKRAVRVMQEHGPPRQHMEARCGLGMALILKGETDKGIKLLEATLAEVRSVAPHPNILLTVTSNLGTLYQHQENWERATRCLEEAVQTCRQLGDPRRLTALLTQLGHCRYMRQDRKGCEAAFSEAIALLRERGPSAELATALSSLGAARADLGRSLPDAEALLKEAVDVARQISGPEGRGAQGSALANLGLFYAKTKRSEEAQGTLISAAGLLERDGQDPRRLAEVRAALKKL